MVSTAPVVPSVIEDTLVFTLDDGDHALTRITLDCDDAVPGQRRFRRTTGGWQLTIPRPDLTRLEYRLVVTRRGGQADVICDPANPERVKTAFGQRSVALMPGYARPAWVPLDVPRGASTELTFVDAAIGELPVTLWSPAGVQDTDIAHLLVVHDGPEYVELADLAQFAAAVIGQGRLPAFRMACLHPVERDAWYAANTDYVRAELAVLDELTGRYPTRDGWVALGASLGGLTSLLAALAAEGRFRGLMCQSGSFFTPELDPQESSYPHFARVVEAVEHLLEATATTRPLEVVLTCGRMEENFANNDAMAAALADQGHLVSFVPVRDLHNYTAWRDALDPSLTDLLRALW
jgi:enterochelin esterase-like enzyme